MCHLRGKIIKVIAVYTTNIRNHMNLMSVINIDEEA